MRDERPALEWYRRCIHERQRRASTLSIEVGLHSDDREDPDSLAETIAYLDEAIAILEQAEAAGHEPLHRKHIADRPEAMMDDLGHSMTPFFLAPMRLSNAFASAGTGWRGLSVEESLRFFE
jgi:hypothetical protein